MRDVYMVHLTLPDFFSSEMWGLIPAQRAMVNDLIEKRVILNYSLDMERKNLWIYMQAKDLIEINSIVKKFPIIKFVKIRIHELAFHDSAPVGLPELFLN